MFKFRILGADAHNTATYQFAGLDRRARIADGSCREMRNMCTDDAPCLSPRKGRRQLTEYDAATMLLHKDGKPLAVDGAVLRYDGAPVGTVAAGRKRTAVMND